MTTEQDLHSDPKWVAFRDQINNMRCLAALFSASRHIHETVRAYSRTHGDHAYQPWHLISTELKKSVLQGLFAVLRDPSTTPRESHENWSRTRLADGWVWGPEKNMEKKTHPCLVPYEYLPEHQRFKDDLFLQCARNCIETYRLRDIEDLDAMACLATEYVSTIVSSYLGDPALPEG